MSSMSVREALAALYGWLGMRTRVASRSGNLEGDQRAPTTIGGHLTADCKCLLAMQNELVGSASLNWCANLSPREWEGVTLSDKDDSVVGIVLSRRHLDGQVPREIRSLANLRKLDLSDNSLNGVIPPGIGKLTNLRELDLGNNLLCGPIPREIGKLTNLTKLRLWKNDLSGPIPNEVWELPNLIDKSGIFRPPPLLNP